MKKTKLFIIQLLLFTIHSMSMTAQEYVKVTGSVFSKNGEALIGADIRESGTENYTTTDIDGNFRLFVSSLESDIEIRSIGFTTMIIPAESDLSHIVLKKENNTGKFHIKGLYSHGTMKLTSGIVDNLKTNYGSGISLGGSFFFGRNYSGPVKFGLTADYMDICANNYKILESYYWGQTSAEINQIQFGIGLGPVIMIGVSEKISLQVYSKYTPSFSILDFTDDNISGETSYTGFSNGFSCGSEISLGRVGVGIEYRSFATEYSSEDEAVQSVPSIVSKPASKTFVFDEGKVKYRGIIAYITVKF